VLHQPGKVQAAFARLVSERGISGVVEEYVMAALGEE
jgi:hypothetical protein